MGRPVSFDRQEAIQTVMEEIWRQGYKACSVKAISEKLGITRSSFYNSFGSREDLFMEVLAAYAAESPDRVLDEMPGVGSIPEALHQMFREVCRVRAADPEARGCMAVNGIAELVGNNDAIGPRLEDAFHQNIQRFERVVHAGIKRGEIEDKDPPVLALALQNLLIGINLLSKVVKKEDALWSMTENTLNGLGIIAPTSDARNSR